MDGITYTNSSLTCARRCLREYQLRYLQQLEPALDQEHEALTVGTTWHRAHGAQAKGGDPYLTILQHAPSELWAVKLSRLFAAHQWYWRSEHYRVVESEMPFCVEIDGRTFEGQIDGVVQLSDGRRGVLELKTTSDDLDAASSYWSKLRLDTQVGLYGAVLVPAPDFILYDVVRKPTIRPKSLTKAEVARMLKELNDTGVARYYGEPLDEARLAVALDAGHETAELYGARLTADIGDRPQQYFARREIPRTERDYAMLKAELVAQSVLLEHATEHQLLLHRNPDACTTFGRTCDFFGLCSNNVRPNGSAVPDGFRRREHRHPELAR